MKTYSGYEWLLIDIANNMGLDKLTFEERIQWAQNNLQALENLTDKAEVPSLYTKAVMALRKAQRGVPTGHLVEVDACCSGIQVMSALTGCVSGAMATGLIDPDVRADAYSSVTQEMNKILGGTINITRAQAKEATMTTMYGSKKVPQRIFGEDTPELNAFFQAANTVAPGAWELLQDLLATWKPYALSHQWKMPDGFDVRVKVMTKKEVRIEVDELNHATFSYEFYENNGSRTGLSNAANAIHSMDAFILREMHRRCNYDREVIEEVANTIEMELIRRSLGGQQEQDYIDLEGQVTYYIEQFTRSTLVSAVILPHIDCMNVVALSDKHLGLLAGIVNGMLEYQSFELVTVHDAFRSHANNVNTVRWQYKEILAEIADSNVLDDLLSQLHGQPGTFNKLSSNLGDKIRNSSYALC